MSDYKGRMMFGGKTRNQRYRLLLNDQAPTDPLISDVKLIVNFTGTPGVGNADCVDLGPDSHLLFYHANTNLSATDDPVNNIGQYLPGSTGTIYTAGSTADWEIGSQDFCLEFFMIHGGSWNSINYFLSAGSTLGWYVFVGRSSNENGELRLYHNNANLGGVQLFGNISADTWYHIAITRSGSDLRFFLDGVQQGATQAISATLDSNNAALVLGGVSTATASAGDLDQVRITIGSARYVEDFTPPTEDYPLA